MAGASSSEVRSNAERTAATRGALLAAGEELFGDESYAAVSIDAIVQRAGVTRGALYHHFKDKRELFRAVFEQTEAGIVPRIAETLEGASDPWELMLRGSEKFLDICREPRFQQIALVDAPAVLGPAEQQEIAERYGGALVQATLTGLMEAGEVAELPVVPLARMLTGALVSGATVIAEADDQETARREVGTAIEALLGGLRV